MLIKRSTLQFASDCWVGGAVFMTQAGGLLSVVWQVSINLRIWVRLWVHECSQATSVSCRADVYVHIDKNTPTGICNTFAVCCNRWLSTGLFSPPPPHIQQEVDVVVKNIPGWRSYIVCVCGGDIIRPSCRLQSAWVSPKWLIGARDDKDRIKE